MVVCSSSPAVASRCVHLRAGMGAVASPVETVGPRTRLRPQRHRRDVGRAALAPVADDLGASLEVHAESAPYAEFRTDELLLETYVRHATSLGRRFSTGADSLMNRASTDMGNVSQRIPAIHPYIGIDSAPAVNHQLEFAAAAASRAADRAVLDGALALALTLADTASTPHLRERLLGAHR
jgi:metal-dependent amidase/aminoacylase/carboxypeptidase family protein